MTEAEKICSGVSPKLHSQAVTLANAVFAMQAKIDQQIPIYEQMPLAQQVTVGTGEKMLRANPAVQEFRATVRDYATALNSLNSILEKTEDATSTASSLDALRGQFKVAK